MKRNYVFALDFDGVICDSAGETATSGWKAGAVLWPDLFRGPLAEELAESFAAVRPVLKTGYESLLLLRLLVEGKTPKEIQSDYPALKQQLVTTLSLDTDQLKLLFGEARDEWVRKDSQSWLSANGNYPGTIDAINSCKCPVYIITTKQKRFAEALVSHFRIRVPKERIFGLESGPKVDTLAKLLRINKNATVFFVEDNIQSLENKHLKGFHSVRRIFAKWGYSTYENRDQAEQAENITPITLAEFSVLLSTPGKFL